MFNTSWFLPKAANPQDGLFQENQLLKNQIQELLSLEETGFFIELDSLLKAILRKALILCKAECSFFALAQPDTSKLDVRITNQILDEKMSSLLAKFDKEYPQWQESESELITIDDFIILPLTRRHRMLGVIGLKLNSSAPENVCELLPILAWQAAVSLESAILYEKMFKRLLVLSNVFILGKEIISNLNLAGLVDKFLSVARDGTSSEVASVILLQEYDMKPSFNQVQLHTGPGSFVSEDKLMSPVVMQVLKTKKPLIVEDLANSEFGQDEANRISAVTLRNALYLPLSAQEVILGIIQVSNKSGKFPYSSEDVDLLKILSSQIAFVIQNARLFLNLQQAYIHTLSALTSAIDAKDSYTHGHSERVTQLSIELAREVSLSAEAIEEIRLAGTLHDIGKIGIPESILNKPGRLTDEEFGVIKSHPDLGVRILANVDFLSKIIPGIKHHHERYDGHGYPTGLKGEEIPLSARIICVADTYDAMTSDRPYRKAMDTRTALEEISRCRNSQFDPSLADAFVQMMGRR